MSDLVARLRAAELCDGINHDLMMIEAADAIEQRDAEINRLRSAIEDVLMRREDCICAFTRKRLGEALQGEEEP